MEHPATTLLQVGDWCVNPSSGQLTRDGETARLEVRTMRLLVCLAERPGEVVSIEELLNQVWPGVSVAPDSVYQAIASLRRQLGDDPKQPSYIVTVPRLGYRLVAKVSPWEDLSANAMAVPEVSPPRRKSAFTWAAASAMGRLIVVAVLFRNVAGSQHSPSSAAAPLPKQSIAVLPFLDLTQGMKEEEFADGITEELIDRLTKIPDLQVPSPTSVFYFKNKQIPLADIARSLGVAYVLDGSVRKSGGRVRIAARLIRPGNGYVIWSETYDRPFDDILKVQDGIASEVTKALQASIVNVPKP